MDLTTLVSRLKELTDEDGHAQREKLYLLQKDITAAGLMVVYSPTYGTYVIMAENTPAQMERNAAAAADAWPD